MSIRLYDSKLEENGLHIYVFIVEKCSKIGSELYSKPFHFSGHRWKIQAGIKEKHFGVFLRWLGGGELTKGVKCKVNFTLGVLNRNEHARSIRRGNLDDKADEFTKSGCGIGWGKLASLEELLDDGNFISDDSATVELQCRLVETTFENRLPCELKPGDKFLQSSMFTLCNSRWSIMMFPHGPPDKNDVSPQNDHVAVYLHCEDVGLRRYKLEFSFHVRSKLAKQREIMYNYFDTCHDACNVFGIERFMPTKELKKIAKNGKVKIRLKIKSIVPYFYLALNPANVKNTEGDTCTRGDLVDQCNNRLGLTLEKTQYEKLVFKLKYDPQGENDSLDEMPYFKKIFWRVVLNSFENDSETVVVSSLEEAGKSSFCYSKAECSIASSLETSKVRSVQVSADQLGKG